MTEYIIAGQKFQVPVAIENERYIRFSTEKPIKQVGTIFDKWYSSQSSIKSIINNADKVLSAALDPIADIGVKMLNENGLYTMNELIFWKKYCSKIEDHFWGAIEYLEEQIDDVNEEEAALRRQRQSNKANRGKVVGGGFGLGGAIKGMATAGVINAATGAVYSIGNAVGNMGSSVAASLERDSVIREAREPLKEVLIDCAYKTRDAIRTVFKDELKFQFKIITESDEQQAYAIMANYKQGRIPNAQKVTQILNALLLNPYSSDIYDTIWNDYGDKNGDLMKMSKFFGDTLSQRIGAKVTKFGDDIFTKYCSVYESAFNKRWAAVVYEQQIKLALDTLIEYCDTHSVSEDMVPQIKRCRQLLQEVDLYQRTVHGTVYDTRKLASDVKKDYDTFFRILSGLDINDAKTCQIVKSESYLTDEFKNRVETLLKEEQSFRNPTKLLENIVMFVRKGLNANVTDAGWIDIPGRLGEFQQKEGMVRSLTAMPAEELPLILFSRSKNGKSGVLLTNLFIRIYSKELFSNENTMYPIEKVKRIECCENNKYVISLKGQDDISFMIKQKLSPEEQIALGDTMSKLVHLISNLSSTNRTQLYRMFFGIATCTCGTRLLLNEKVCPTCHCLIRESGEVVESQRCSRCGNLVPVKKKFCSVCGLQLVTENPEQRDIAPSVNTAISEIRCANCNYFIKPGKKFCPSCGNKIINE